MGFALSDVGCSSLNSYDDALKHWEKSKCWRGKTERKLYRSSRNMGVTKNEDGVIKFRYHSTDVVTWYPDDHFEVRGWSSHSTNSFANGFTPSSLQFNFTARRYYDTWWVTRRASDDERRVYELKPATAPIPFHRHMTDWIPDPDFIEPIVIPCPDKTKTRAVLKSYDFGTFVRWIEAAALFGEMSEAIRTATIRSEHVVEMLADRDHWGDFLKYHTFRASWDKPEAFRSYIEYGKRTPLEYRRATARKIVDLVRVAVYKHHNLILEEGQPYFEGSQWKLKEKLRLAEKWNS